jgi:eukaryotic-like serine/threonine-protein kinase
LPLTSLHCQDTKVTDLSPLKDSPLKELWCDFKAERDAAILRSIKTLEKINDKPAADFWKEVDGK